jgi:hypothetical protein
MTTIRFLSAGLIATAMFIAPAMARQHHVTPRLHAEDIDASVPQGTRYIDGTFCIPAPRVGAFATQPWDKAPPCEPTMGYYPGASRQAF